MIKEFSKEKCMDIYKKLKLGRRFEEKIVELSEKGEIPGSIHPACGMEAVGVGLRLALNEKDLLIKTHRGHPIMIAEGADIRFMFSELMGKANGYNKGKGGSMHLANVNGVVGSAVALAAGAALASKLKNKNQVAVGLYGDGAANQGPVFEVMNMAAIWKLPVVFICENNQYAVSTSVKYSSPLENLSERACAFGIPGVTVDGMDLIEIYKAAKELIERARSGIGPSILECKTYRYYGHWVKEPTLGLNYRTDEEIEYWKSRDPIKLWSKKILDEGICSQDEITEIDSLIENEIELALEFAYESDFPEPEEAYKDMYATEYEGIPQKGW